MMQLGLHWMTWWPLRTFHSGCNWDNSLPTVSSGNCSPYKSLIILHFMLWSFTLCMWGIVLTKDSRRSQCRYLGQFFCVPFYFSGTLSTNFFSFLFFFFLTNKNLKGFFFIYLFIYFLGVVWTLILIKWLHYPKFTALSPKSST